MITSDNVTVQNVQSVKVERSLSGLAVIIFKRFLVEEKVKKKEEAVKQIEEVKIGQKRTVTKRESTQSEETFNFDRHNI